MRSYETALILVPQLSEDELDSELANLEKTISSNEGTLKSTRKWGKRQLAYPIRKINEGIYVFLRWDGAEAVSTAIDKHLSLNDNYLRHLSIRIGGKTPVAYELQIRDYSREQSIPPGETRKSSAETEIIETSEIEPEEEITEIPDQMQEIPPSTMDEHIEETPVIEPSEEDKEQTESETEMKESE